MANDTCSVDGCARRHKARGLCSTHYQRWRTTGSTAAPPPRTTVVDRFWAKVAKGDGCWQWTATTTHGYGRFRLESGRMARAHRVAYEWLVGPIPDGLEIDHLCRNRACVKPAHLEVVTSAENTRRGDTVSGRNAKKTHCKRGHPLAGANLILRPSGGRSCRTCVRETKRRYRERRRS